MRKRYVSLFIILLLIGFAATSATLIIDGTIGISTKNDDFDIYFSQAILDNKDISRQAILQNRKNITFTTRQMHEEGETSTLLFEVTNNSKQYDAEVIIECAPTQSTMSQYVKIIPNKDKYNIPAKTREVGNLTIELLETTGQEETIEFICELNAQPNSRESVIDNFLCDYEEGYEWEFDYDEEAEGFEEFDIPCHGEYKIELWGASGGDSRNNGSVYKNRYGLGGYTSGVISLMKQEKLYVFVGGKGTDAVIKQDSAGGYNGGGLGTWDGEDDESSGGGGGATDIRLTPGIWNDFESLKSRIMVAAGGGGQSWEYNAGYGGGLSGYSPWSQVLPGTQTSGYAFGFGQDAFGFGDTDGVGGGGSGYYGGETKDLKGKSTGSGGSSFISGHEGCDAISEESTLDNIIHTNQPNHYSKYIFTNTVMIDGAGYKWSNIKESYIGMPTFDGSSTMKGNYGNGHAKITLVKLT